MLNHQYWRLITSVFVHGGLIHIAMNMWSLYVIGPLVERLFGNLAFAVIYLASGVGGRLQVSQPIPCGSASGLPARFADCSGHSPPSCSCIAGQFLPRYSSHYGAA